MKKLKILYTSKNKVSFVNMLLSVNEWIIYSHKPYTPHKLEIFFIKEYINKNSEHTPFLKL